VTRLNSRQENAMRHTASIAALCATLAGCATAKITTEFDPKIDYGAFKTYAWITAQPGPEQAPAIRNPTVQLLVKEAVDRELAGRGLARAGEGQADLLVAVHGISQDRIEVSSYGYAYGPRPYGVYGYGMPVATGTDVRQYRDGTLILDLVDARTKELAWRGTVSDTVSSPEEVRRVIDAGVKKLLAEYPPKPSKK
jgi:hypothetical protein